MFDYQREDLGGAGWLGLMTFLPDDTVDIRLYSPYLDRGYAKARDTFGFSSYTRIDLDVGAAFPIYE